MRKASKRDIEAAMRRAKAAEEHEPMPAAKAADVFKEGVSTLDSLKRFLRRAWFISDTDAEKPRKSGGKRR